MWNKENKNQTENKKKIIPETTIVNENVVIDEPIIINLSESKKTNKINIIEDNKEIVIDILPKDKPDVKLEVNYKSMDELTKQEMRMYRRTGVLPKLNNEII
jgi:hypothetical protein